MNEPVSDSAASVKRYYWTPRAMHVLLRDEQAPGLHVTFITESDYAAAIAERAAAQRECERLKRELEANDAAWCKSAIQAIAGYDVERRELIQLREQVERQKFDLDNLRLDREQCNAKIREQAAEIERLKSCISAQSWMCAKYHEAVALLRECDSWGPTVCERVINFLATIDAEEAKLKESKT
jgi:hypothetical protein